MFSLIKKTPNPDKPNKWQHLKEPRQSKLLKNLKHQSPQPLRKESISKNLASNLCSLTAGNILFVGSCKWNATKTCLNMFGKG